MIQWQGVFPLHEFGYSAQLCLVSTHEMEQCSPAQVLSWHCKGFLYYLLDIVNCREEFFLYHSMFLVSLVSFHLCTSSYYPDLNVGPGAATIDVNGPERCRV